MSRSQQARTDACETVLTGRTAGLNRAELNGRAMKVNEAKPREQRTDGGMPATVASDANRAGKCQYPDETNGPLRQVGLLFVAERLRQLRIVHASVKACRCNDRGEQS
jgi:hypothetical protein